MYCPEHLVFQAGRGKYLRVTLWLYWRDVPRDTIPMSVWLNPFRYQLSLVSRFKKLATVNPRGQWWNRMLAAAERAPEANKGLHNYDPAAGQRPDDPGAWNAAAERKGGES